jgi:hypothetical protein
MTAPKETSSPPPGATTLIVLTRRPGRCALATGQRIFSAFLHRDRWGERLDQCPLWSALQTKSDILTCPKTAVSGCSKYAASRSPHRRTLRAGQGRFFVEHGSGAAIRRVDRRASRSARQHARSDHFFSTVADNRVIGSNRAAVAKRPCRPTPAFQTDRHLIHGEAFRSDISSGKRKT